VTLTREIARSHYKVAPLREVVEFLDHRRRPVKESDREPGPYPYYGANGQQGTVDNFIFDEPLILMAEDGGHFEEPSRGIAYSISGRTWVNNHAHVLKPKRELVDFSFLLRVLESYDVGPFISGTTRGKLTKAQAEKIEIPLPPLDEQRRIAAILDKSDALRRKRKHALELLDGLPHLIFKEMFSSVTAPARSAVKRLSDVTECLDYMRRPVKESERPNGDVPYYGANGQQGWIDRPLFNEPLVLVAEDGGHFSDPTRGVAYRIEGPAWVNNHAHILRPLKNKVMVSYLHNALVHFNFVPFISGTTRSKLTQAQLNRVELLIPPMDLQKEFDTRIGCLIRSRLAHVKALAYVDELFTSLQHRAFSGQL